jgi:hypothetical protein
MRAEQHDFGGQRRIGTGDLREDVVAVGVAGQVARADVDAHLHWHPVRDHPRDHVVVFGSEHDGGDGVLALVAAEHEDGAMFAGAPAQHDARLRVADDLRDLPRLCLRPRALPRHRRRPDPHGGIILGRLRTVRPDEAFDQGL